jgi:hypothetical protein
METQTHLQAKSHHKAATHQHMPGLVLQRKCACGGNPGPSGECDECRKKRLGMVQRLALNVPAPMTVPPIVHQVLDSPGQPLDAGTRNFMEPRFGHNFSQVQVHTDGKAAQSAQAVNALAYTVGKDMVFAAGQYAPGTAAGDRLLAHELTHVVQQSRPMPMQAKSVVSQPQDAQEQEADRAASQIASGDHVGTIAIGRGMAQIQRQGPQTSSPVAETPALRQQRLAAASRLRISISQFRSALGGGLAWNFERIIPQGNQMGVGSVTVVEPMTSRQARLTQLMNDLIQFTIILESGPVPANWLNPQITMPPSTFLGAAMGGSIMTSFGSGPDWENPLRFFTNWQLERGRDAGALTINLTYIPDPPQAGRMSGIPRVAIQDGINIGIWIVVPNVDTQPMQYHRLMPTENWPAAETIFEIWHDSAGYYYLHNRERHYLPGRP